MKIIFYNSQSNRSIIIVAYYFITFLVLAPFDHFFVFLNALMQERPRNHLDLHNRLDSKAQREGEVFYYR